MSKSVTIDTNELEWSGPSRGYYKTDVKQKVLYRDEETGALLALVKFPKGLADDIHSHPKANQHVFWLKGEMINDDGNAFH